MSVKIAINGFGRIGRLTFRHILDHYPELEIVAVNDLTDTKTLAHLLHYDSSFGIYSRPIKYTENSILIDGHKDGVKLKVLAQPDPQKLPWKALGVDIVLECTGRFTDLEGAKKHIIAGAKQVIISAPAKSEAIPSFVLGVNEEKFDPKKDKICDMGSCTTNCLAPVTKVLQDNFGIRQGFMTTVHSYTSDQRILDLPHKDIRRARAAALNIIPTTTGAARAISKVIPELKGKLDGMAIRVPTPVVSIVDLTYLLEKPTTKEEVNYILRKASQSARLKGILGVEDAELVSSDFKCNTFSAIVDANLTKVNKNLVKVLAWYDNEWGYSTRLADFAAYIAGTIK